MPKIYGIANVDRLVGSEPDRDWAASRSCLVRDIRPCEQSMGDGIKRDYEDEIPVMKKLRRVGAAV